MTESMIERIVEVLEKLPIRDNAERGGELDKLRLREAARAMIRAMREPLGVMEGAGNLEIDQQRTNEGGNLYRKARASKFVWQAMIDAALIWPPGSADIAGVPMARD